MKNESKKISFYSPGMISLILLPIFGIIFLQNRNAFTKYYAQTYYALDPDSKEKEKMMEFVNHKEFKKIVLTGNDELDKENLNKSKLDIRQLVKSEDTLKGIQYQFSNKSKYWTLIRVLEILENEKAKAWVIYKDDIWVANPKKAKHKIIEVKNACLLCNDLIPIKSQAQIARERQEKINYYLENGKKYFIPIMIYILMLGLTIKRIIKGYS